MEMTQVATYCCCGAVVVTDGRLTRLAADGRAIGTAADEQRKISNGEKG